MPDPADIAGPTIEPAPERTHVPPRVAMAACIDADDGHCANIPAPDFVDCCTRSHPCETRSQLDLALCPEGTCSLLIRDEAWMLMDDRYAVVAAVTHCPWCGRVLG